MDWDAIGALGEIIGATAVVITVGYLALQTRQNTRATKSATHHSVTIALAGLSRTISQAGVAKAFTKAHSSGLSSLSAEEFLIFSAQAFEIFKLNENAYFQFKEGQLDARAWAGAENYLVDRYSMSAFQEWFETPRARWFSKEYIQFLEAKRREFASSSFLDKTFQNTRA